MPDFKILQDLPDISFIENRSIDDVRRDMVGDFEAFMSEATGKPFALERADPHRMELYAMSTQFYHGLQYVDRAGKLNLLKYTYGAFLDNVAVIKSVTRQQAKAATTTLRFTLSAARAAATGIPQGTRVSTPTGSVYFQTTEYAEIPEGFASVDVPAICTEVGTAGSDLEPGELNTMVDPVPYMASVVNVTKTAGGAEKENDDSMKERVFLAPGSYSTAGPDGGYRYWVKSYNTAIGDVQITSDHAAGTVDICFLMADGSAPSQEMITGLLDFLQEQNVRPTNDLVRASAPEEVPYTVDLQYWIGKSDTARASAIQTAVEAAVAKYVRWQRAIGRDINPSQLVAAVVAAGAKRVKVNAPVDTQVGSTQVAALSGIAVVSYGGLEND